MNQPAPSMRREVFRMADDDVAQTLIFARLDYLPYAIAGEFAEFSIFHFSAGAGGPAMAQRSGGGSVDHRRPTWLPA